MIERRDGDLRARSQGVAGALYAEPPTAAGREKSGRAGGGGFNPPPPPKRIATETLLTSFNSV